LIQRANQGFGCFQLVVGASELDEREAHWAWQLDAFDPNSGLNEDMKGKFRDHRSCLACLRKARKLFPSQSKSDPEEQDSNVVKELDIPVTESSIYDEVFQ
jgi:hypothetical protein